MAHGKKVRSWEDFEWVGDGVKTRKFRKSGKASSPAAPKKSKRPKARPRVSTSGGSAHPDTPSPKKRTGRMAGSDTRNRPNSSPTKKNSPKGRGPKDNRTKKGGRGDGVTETNRRNLDRKSTSPYKPPSERKSRMSGSDKRNRPNSASAASRKGRAEGSRGQFEVYKRKLEKPIAEAAALRAQERRKKKADK